MLALLAGRWPRPIDGLGEDYLFSAHMVQHVLLGDIAPALLLLSLSRVILRPATRRLMRGRARARAASRTRGRASPSGSVLMYLWHIPALYDAALENPLVHLLEHVSFFTAGRGGVVAADPAGADAPAAHGPVDGRLHRHRQVRAGRARALPDLVGHGALRLLRERAADLGPVGRSRTRTRAARS